MCVLNCSDRFLVVVFGMSIGIVSGMMWCGFFLCRVF